MPAIEVEHVTKEYRLGALQGLKQTVLNAGARLLGRPVEEPPLFKALDDVSFSIEPGEVVGIIGHNGAGKSTLLKLLAGISQPTRGRVKVNGRVAPLIEVGAGFVPDFTGRENVYLNAAILGMSKKEIDRKFDEIIDFAEIAGFIDTPVKRYSSGMQVKLAFAVATSVDAEILIVDEVLAVGDLAFQQRCIERMDTLIRRDGRTVLVVSHNIRQIERLCKRALLMECGRLASSGTTKDVCSLFFQRTQERTLQRKQSSRSGYFVPQRDAGIIDVLGIELLDDQGERVTSIGFHESLTLRVCFRCKSTLRRPEIIVGFHTSDFVQVLAASNAMSGVQPDLEAGKHEFSCRFSKIPLRPFAYGLRIIFVDHRNGTLWAGEDVLTTLVTPGATDITKFPSTGLVFTRSNWHFNQLESKNNENAAYIETE